MVKNIKATVQKHKKSLLIGGIGCSLALAVGIGAYTVINGSDSEPSLLSEEDQTEAVTEFETQVFDEPVTYAESTEEFETLMPRLNEENQVRLLDIYLFELDGQLNQLSGMVSVLQEDLLSYDEDVDTLLSDSFIEKLPDNMVKGFLSELQNSYFVLSQDDDGIYSVKTDYPTFEEEYAESLSEDMKDYLALAEHSNEHEYYDSAAGHALFPELKDRLDLIRSLMDDDEAVEDSQLAVEEYMIYQALLGVADVGMNTEEGDYNQDAIDEMKIVIESSDDEQLNQDMQTIIDSMTEEGSYNDTTEELALSIVEDRFSELLASMENELDVESDTDAKE